MTIQNTQPNPVRIQVVFQGGGAKLCLLMAVAEVLQQHKGIELRRIGGSSAGAIVAAMLASKTPIGEYKERLIRIAPGYLKATDVGLLRGLWRIARGKAFFEGLNLAAFFKELFCPNSEPTKLSDLAIADTHIYYTDLYSLASRVAPADEPLATALAKSCRFPLALVGASSGNTEVDGGLALNLPVDRFKDEESKFGPVIAIGFTNRFGTPADNNVLAYTQQLFSAAVQAGVARSETILGIQNVHRIDTEIETFDFETALGEGFGTSYMLAKQRFDTWLAEWLRLHGRSAANTTTQLVHPVITSNPWPLALTRELDARSRAAPLTKAKSLRHAETAILDDTGAFTGKYKSRAIKIFTLMRPTNVLQFEFQIGKEGSFSAANLGCMAMDANGTPLAFSTHVQEMSTPHVPLRTFRVYILFEQTIGPESSNQPYCIEYKYEATGAYPNLSTGAEAASLGMLQGEAESAVLCVAFPRSVLGDKAPTITDIASATKGQLNAAQYGLTDGEVFCPSETLAVHEFIDLLSIAPHSTERFVFVGRRVLSSNLGSTFGFVIERA